MWFEGWGGGGEDGVGMGDILVSVRSPGVDVTVS